MAAGILLIIAALALLIYNRREDAEAGRSAEEVMPALKDAAEEKKGDPDTGLELDGEIYIGYLTIPSLDLELPVMREWDYAKLKISPCRYYGSVETDDLVICGHNYDRHFGRLKTLESGAQVTFTGLDGETVSYEVSAIETLQPDEVEYMTESPYDLTLYTCTYGGQSRVTVRCIREN